jgi:hypothetical protein
MRKRLPFVIATAGILCTVVAAALSLTWVLEEDMVDSKVRMLSPESESDAGSSGSQPESRATPPTPRVLAASPRGILAYRPTRIPEEAGWGIDNIRWRTYGGRTAVGTGVDVDNGDERVTIRLRDKRDCAGSPTYMKWSVEREGARPTGFGDMMSPHIVLEACYPEPEPPEPLPTSTGS